MTADVRGSFELRRNDFSFEDDHVALRDAFRSFLAAHSPADRVRKSEPAGFDADLWRSLQDLRAVAMGLPEAMGGDGAGLVELAVVAEEIGRRAAPVPFVEAVTAARALAAISAFDAAAVDDELVAALVGGTTIASVAIGPVIAGRTLVPAGAVAGPVLAWREGDLVVLDATADTQPVANLGAAPLAWRAVAQGTVVATGAAAKDAFARIEVEWRVLTAALLVGLGQSALDLAVQYAKDRLAFGTPIGSFQAIAHPLVDCHIGLASARRLTFKAAWLAEHEPELGGLSTMAFIKAAEASETAGAVAIHTQGGFGFTSESDVQLFYRRAKGVALVAGDRRHELRRLADELYGPLGSPAGTGSAR